MSLRVTALFIYLMAAFLKEETVRKQLKPKCSLYLALYNQTGQQATLARTLEN